MNKRLQRCRVGDKKATARSFTSFSRIDEYGGNATVGQHMFYLYNPTTSANVVSKERVREKPLPASFGGMCSDIEVVFLVFHLLIPTKRNIGFTERMAIDDGVGRLIIKGLTNNGRR
jgi:hypothetical protein